MRIRKSKIENDYDSPWKDVLDVLLEPFIEFFFPLVHKEIDWKRGVESLEQELRQILRAANQGKRVVDKLVRVHTHAGEALVVLIHIEIQCQYEADFPRRMFTCHYRLFDKYGTWPVNLVLFGDDRPKWNPREFEAGQWGCGVKFWYPTAKLLDYEDHRDKLADEMNPMASMVLAHLVSRETRGAPEERQAAKLKLVKGLYRAGWTKKTILCLYHVIDWMLDLPKELELQFLNEVQKFEEQKNMRYVSSAERIGVERGMELGRQEGIQRGRQEERQEAEERERKTLCVSIQTILELRFDEDGLSIAPQVKQIQELDRLRAIHAQLIARESFAKICTALKAKPAKKPRKTD